MPSASRAGISGRRLSQNRVRLVSGLGKNQGTRSRQGAARTTPSRRALLPTPSRSAKHAPAKAEGRPSTSFPAAGPREGRTHPSRGSFQPLSRALKREREGPRRASDGEGEGRASAVEEAVGANHADLASLAPHASWSAKADHPRVCLWPAVARRKRTMPLSPVTPAWSPDQVRGRVQGNRHDLPRRRRHAFLKAHSSGQPF
jgi:hypothetical protein